MGGNHWYLVLCTAAGLMACGRADVLEESPEELKTLESELINLVTFNLPATIYNSGSSEQQFLTGDFNGDGRTDFAQTYRGWNSVPVCLSTGTGWSCSNLETLIYNSGSAEQEFLTGDYNGDGAADIFQTYRGWQSIPVSLRIDVPL